VLEESLALAREQLVAANQRAQALEVNAQEREAEGARLRERIQLQAAVAVHQSERTQLQERHNAAESHWMLELDRARQDAKESARDHERQLEELRMQIGSLRDNRDELRQQLGEARAEVKVAAEGGPNRTVGKTKTTDLTQVVASKVCL